MFKKVLILLSMLILCGAYGNEAGMVQAAAEKNQHCRG